MMQYQNLQFFLSAIGKRFANPNAMYVELTFDSTPVLSLTKAPLLYDKKVAFSMRYDDTAKSAYNNSLALFLGGEFFYDEENNTHSGFSYTDGCGFSIPYVADFAAQCSRLNSNSIGYINWEDARKARDFGYSIIPQGAYVTYNPTVTYVDNVETYHSPYSEWYNDYVEFRELCNTNLGFRPLMATSDIDHTYWSSILDGDIYKAPFFDAGMYYVNTRTNPKIIAGAPVPLDLENGVNVESITSETFNSGQPYLCMYHSKRLVDVETLPPTGELYYVYRLPNFDMYRWSGSTYYITTESMAASWPLAQIKQVVTNAINSNESRALGIFTHELTYEIDQNDNGGMYLPYFKTEILEWLDQTYGKNGSDQILMASMNTVVEYLYCREFSNINTYYEGNKVILEIIPPINSDLRRPALTFKLNSSVPVTNISINNIDRFSQNVIGNTSGIINLEWGSEYYNVADSYVTIAENSRTRKSIDTAIYFMTYVTEPTKLATLQSRINNIVELTDIRHLIDFGRSFYPSTTPPYNNINTSDVDLSLFLPTNISIRDITNGDYGVKIDIINPFDIMTYDGVITTDDSGIYLDSALRDSFSISGSTAILKIHGLESGQVVDFSFLGSTTASGRITRYEVRNQLTGSTFLSTVLGDNTNNTSITSDITNSFANINGEIYILISREIGSLGYLSVLDFTTKQTFINPNFILQSININSGDTECGSIDVNININYTGTATQYMISESSIFDNGNWITFSGLTGDNVLFQLSNSNGLKTLFVKLKTSSGIISNVLYKSITLALPGSKVIVSLGHDTYSTNSYPVVSGETLNFMKWTLGESLVNFPLKSTEGIIKGSYVVKPSLMPVDSTIKLFALGGGSAPVLTGNTGTYPDLYFSKYYYVQSANTLGNKGLFRISGFWNGEYTVRLYMSTSQVITPANYAKMFLQCNSETPVAFPTQSANNTTVYVEAVNVTVLSDGILDLFIYNTGNLFSQPGLNLIEIIKQ